MVAGNHDHGLVAGWIDGRLETEPSGFLALEQYLEPAEAGPLAAALAGHAAPARVRVAYPGLWLREDVYAIHGHYADLHATVPTFERLATGAMARWVVRLPEAGATPDDYEAVLAPLYAWMSALTQRSEHAVISAGAGASSRAWVALAGDGRRSRPVRAAALGAGYTAAVAALNAAGLGPLDRNLSGPALRRGYLRGIGEVDRAPGDRRAPRDLGPLAPGRPVARRRRRRVGDARRHADPQLRLVGLPAALPLGGARATRPTGRARRSCSTTASRRELVRLLGERGHRELAPPA